MMEREKEKKKRDGREVKSGVGVRRKRDETGRSSGLTRDGRIQEPVFFFFFIFGPDPPSST